MSSKPNHWLGRAGILLGLALTLVACGGHSRLSGAIDGLDLPGDLVEIGEVQSGPDTCFAGDCPAVDRYYVSQQNPERTCAAIEPWADENGLAPANVGEGSSCRFGGSLDGNQLQIIVLPPQDAIPAYGESLDPQPVDVDHKAVVMVGVS
jgi:hypothetical protein